MRQALSSGPSSVFKFILTARDILIVANELFTRYKVAEQGSFMTTRRIGGPWFQSSETPPRWPTLKVVKRGLINCEPFWTRFKSLCVPRFVCSPAVAIPCSFYWRKRVSVGDRVSAGEPVRVGKNWKQGRRKRQMETFTFILLFSGGFVSLCQLIRLDKDLCSTHTHTQILQRYTHAHRRAQT